MPHKLSLVVLLTLSLSFAADLLAQQKDLRLEVDPLLVDDLKGGRTSSLKLIEVEFRVITLNPALTGRRDMDRVRTLFGIVKSDAQGGNNLAVPYGIVSSARTKLSHVKAEGPIKHQVLETGTFEELLSWMTTRAVASTVGHSDQKIALGSTVVVLDQRVSVPRLTAKKDPRTGEEIQKVEFVQSGMHLELTPLSQVFPRQNKQGEVWQLRLDRVITSRLDGEGQKQKIDRAQHTVTVAVGQTALIPSLVQTDRPAFVLLSVKAPKPKPDPGVTVLTPTGEVIHLSKDPGGPRLADRISKTLTATEGAPTPRLYKPKPTKDAESKAILVVASGDQIDVAETASARPRGKQAGVVQRFLKESELPLQQDARILEVHEQEVVLLSFPENITDLSTDGDKSALDRVDVLAPDSLLIRAGKKGVGSLSVKSAKNVAGKTNTFRIEVIVRGDTRLLSHTLEKLFPNDTVELTEVNSAIVIRGKVSRDVVAKQIVEIAEQFYPQVLNQMEARDLEPSRTEKEATNPKAAPTIGTEIRELRTDVKSLRDEIQKLIKVMEGKLEPGAKLDKEASLPNLEPQRAEGYLKSRVKFQQPAFNR
jgi:hypothetical protein